MTTDLTHFDLAEALRCRRVVRGAASDAATMDVAAQRICQALYDELRTDDLRTPACVMVRCYKTHGFGALPADLQRYVLETLGDFPVHDAMRCLVLLGSVGARPEWNSPRQSRGHRAIALPTADVVDRAPMIAQLFKQLGVPIEGVVAPSPDLVRALAGKTYGVFHVKDALGSPFIPAQAEFVVRHGVRSVVGFGGTVTNGDLFAVIVFSRVAISESTADRFRALALEVKSSLFLFPASRTFDSDNGA